MSITGCLHVLYVISIAFLSLATSMPMMGQATSDTSYAIPEVVITESREKHFEQHNFNQEISSEKIQDLSHHDLGDVIQTLTTAHVNTYGGAGGAASISIRGTASDHTAVTWNGFNINSITLGQADISTIDAIAVDRATILSGATATIFGSGTFGGVVQLENTPQWKRRLQLGYGAKGGSFHDHRHNLQLRLGNKNIQYHLAGTYHQAKNDFAYTDIYKIDRPEVEGDHNSSKNLAVVQHLFLKTLKQHQLQGGLWIQHKQKDIPLTMGKFGESNEEQQDFAVRGYMTWRKVTKSGLLNAGTAYIFDAVHYTDKVAADDEDYLIDSEIKGYRSLNKMNYQHHFNAHFQGSAGMEFNLLKARSNNFSNIPTERLASFYADSKLSFHPAVFKFSVRQEVDPGNILRPIFSGSLELSVIPEHLVLLVAASEKFRRPDFNERYWSGSGAHGNPNLDNEQGWGVEYGTKGVMRNEVSDHEFSAKVNGYYTSITNGIIWQPQEGAWTPINVKSVYTSGLETNLKYQFDLNDNIQFPIQLLYHFNRTINKETGNVMAYKPTHSLKANLGFIQKFIRAGLHWNLISERFTDDSENVIFALQKYHLLDLTTTGTIAVEGMDLHLGFEIRNLLDEQYEVRRTYAQPGRAFYATLKINFTQSLKSRS